MELAKNRFYFSPVLFARNTPVSDHRLSVSFSEKPRLAVAARRTLRGHTPRTPPATDLNRTVEPLLPTCPIRRPGAIETIRSMRLRGNNTACGTDCVEHLCVRRFTRLISPRKTDG